MYNLLITGGLGYIGSNVINQLLLTTSYNIIIIDNLCNSNIKVLKNLQNEHPTKKIFFYEYDLKDFEKINEIFKTYEIYAVIHFAGLKSVSESILNPLTYYDNNVYATIQLLNIMELYNVKNFIFSSSATVYGNQKSPLNEKCITGQNLTNPYGKSKYLIEEILKDLKNFNIWCLRYFNPIGSDDKNLFVDNPNGIPNNLYPYIIKVYKKELQHLNIFGNDYDTEDGTCQRDFIHIIDLSNAHICALNNLNEGFNVVNIGTGNGTSVLELVKTFEKVNCCIIPYIFKNKREGDVDVVYCDNTKSFELLNWKPHKTLFDMCKI
jgi:UDP-glucose 4-epimerase